MAYETMKTKSKIMDKERMPGGKKVMRKDMPAVDKLSVGKREAVEERTKKKTKQTEDRAYKVKMNRDKRQ